MPSHACEFPPFHRKHYMDGPDKFLSRPCNTEIQGMAQCKLCFTCMFCLTCSCLAVNIAFFHELVCQCKEFSTWSLSELKYQSTLNHGTTHFLLDFNVCTSVFVIIWCDLVCIQNGNFEPMWTQNLEAEVETPYSVIGLALRQLSKGFVDIGCQMHTRDGNW